MKARSARRPSDASARSSSRCRRSPTRGTRPRPPDEVGTTYISPQVERLLGYTPEEWMSSPTFWNEHIHSDDRARVIEASARADRDGTAVPRGVPIHREGRPHRLGPRRILGDRLGRDGTPRRHAGRDVRHHRAEGGRRANPRCREPLSHHGRTRSRGGVPLGFGRRAGRRRAPLHQPADPTADSGSRTRSGARIRRCGRPAFIPTIGSRPCRRGLRPRPAKRRSRPSTACERRRPVGLDPGRGVPGRDGLARAPACTRA